MPSRHVGHASFSRLPSTVSGSSTGPGGICMLIAISSTSAGDTHSPRQATHASPTTASIRSVPQRGQRSCSSRYAIYFLAEAAGIMTAW
jgi:hypothetical protein